MPELNVTKVSIKNLLSSMQNGRKFIVPDYQRPYAWDKEKCDILWDDLVNFHEENPKPDPEHQYFLGTIVTCKSESNFGNIEIIDGQQRITSLFLLLRAFYFQLEAMQKSSDVEGLQKQLAPCLWDINEVSLEVEDQTKIHIQSEVATEEESESLHEILKTGRLESPNGKKNKYFENYSFFVGQCKEYAQREPTKWKPLIVSILKCIVLPIECDSLETGLTIFSTLNDRGLPLADADIFKAQIYKTKASNEGKKAFADDWKNLSEKSKNANITLDELFRYYTHILRAKAGDSSKEISLRKFYSKDNYITLKRNSDELMNDLLLLCEFWFAVNNRKVTIEMAGTDSTEISTEAHKYFHCLQKYPNEYWKYLTSVFFYANHKNETFAADLLTFLKQITTFLFIKFIKTHTVNTIKDDTFKACIEINKGKKKIPFSNSKMELPKPAAISEESSSKLARALLLLYAYQDSDQKFLIDEKFDIEHIFPKKWQDTNYNGWDREDAQEYLEKFGNKVIIDKKTNIQAGNNYFGKKKEKYEGSKIAVVKRLSKQQRNDWLKNDIDEQEQIFVTTLVTFFKNQKVVN